MLLAASYDAGMNAGSASNRGLVIVAVIASVRVLFHLLTNGAYGFHRDELVLVDDARFLDWGYVAYPPVAPFFARVSMELFGVSTTAIRSVGAISQALVMIVTALIARRLGGMTTAQVIAGVAIGIAPISMAMTSLYQYITLDALWWSLALLGVVLRVADEEPRWWLLIGTAFGLGMMTKYTMAYLVVAVVVVTLATRLRSDLRSRWLWIGALLSFLIWLPNLAWQVSHELVSLEFLQAIHARDVAWGRTDGFLVQQFFVTTSIVTVPLWLGGLWWLIGSVEGKKFRAIGSIFLIVVGLMVLSRARFYYLYPAFVVLMAAGGRWLEELVERLTARRRVQAVSALIVVAAAGAGLSGALLLPLAPIGSLVWAVTAEVHDNFTEQIGWKELVETVDEVWDGFSESERAAGAIYASNYGEAGAINLYGPARGLPRVVSGVNTYWYRGHPSGRSDPVIVLGARKETVGRFFESCEAVAEISNVYGIENEESREPNDVLVCRGMIRDWGTIWPLLRSFG